MTRRRNSPLPEDHPCTVEADRPPQRKTRCRRMPRSAAPRAEVRFLPALPMTACRVAIITVADGLRPNIARLHLVYPGLDTLLLHTAGGLRGKASRSTQL